MVKLHEFKARWIARLGIYVPKNKREEQIRQEIVRKLSYLRAMNLPNLAFTLYTILEKEKISDELKAMLKEMLKGIGYDVEMNEIEVE